MLDGPDDLLPLTPEAIATLTTATAAGGIGLFPAETVYGLAADPRHPDAVHRIAALKRRDPAKPSSVLFWSLTDVLDPLEGDGVPEVVLDALRALLPGPIGVLVPNPAGRFAVAVGEDRRTLGVRVPRLAAPVSAPPIVQTSANLAGEPSPARLDAVPSVVRDGCDVVLDGGTRPGTASTIVDLRGLREDGSGGWRIVREGAVPTAAIAAALAT